MASSMPSGQSPRSKTESQYAGHAQDANSCRYEARGRKREPRSRPVHAASLGPTELAPGTPRQLSASPHPEFNRHVPLGSSTDNDSSPYGAPPPPQSSRPKTRMGAIWAQHRAVILMLASTFCGVTMNTCARFLEHGSGGDDDGPRRRPMHPFQMLFVRMVITVIFGSAYMRWRPDPEFPWGRPEMRRLLLVRGATGFFGIWGMWQSMMYLPVTEATVITFLVPSVTGYLCHLVIHEPFTRLEQIASFIALAGVVLIAQPTSLLGLGDGGQAGAGGDAIAGVSSAAGKNATLHGAAGSGSADEAATPAQRLGAIGIGLIGVLGTAGAFLTIRHMGTRTHPLVSVFYFSWMCTVVSGVALVAGPILDIGQPGLRFEMPREGREWLLLSVICVAGFLTQFLLTASLGGAKGSDDDGDDEAKRESKAATSNRAMSMIYTAMIFAAINDKVIFGIDMTAASFVGCGLIVGSAMWAALSKKEPAAPAAAATEDLEAGGGVVTVDVAGDEGIRLLSDPDESSDEADEAGNTAGAGPRRHGSDLA